MKNKNGICPIPTFNSELLSVNATAQAFPVDTASVRSVQAASLNPELSECGRMAVCIGCTIIGAATLPDAADFCVDVRNVVDRVAPVVARTNGARLFNQ